MVFSTFHPALPSTCPWVSSEGEEKERGRGREGERERRREGEKGKEEGRWR